MNGDSKDNMECNNVMLNCKLCRTENCATLAFQNPDSGEDMRLMVEGFIRSEVPKDTPVCQNCLNRFRKIYEFKLLIERNDQIRRSRIEAGRSGLIYSRPVAVAVPIQYLSDQEPVDADSNVPPNSNSEQKVEEVLSNAVSNIQLESEGEEAKTKTHNVEMEPVGNSPESDVDELGELSPLERAYLKKCEAMIAMYRSFVCQCHSHKYQNLRGLFSHLRSTKTWFPIFTCFHCMITFSNQESIRTHQKSCRKGELEVLSKLSNLKSRSSLKLRIYQNYRCTECRTIFSFYESFCQHINLQHTYEENLNNCSCGKVFDSLDNLKNHHLSSCMIEYYCDLCKTAVKTLDQFVNHAREEHDDLENFAPVIEKKRSKRSSSEALSMDQQETSISEGGSEIKRMKTSRNSPPRCIICGKVYSNRANMMRHFKTHDNELKPGNEVWFFCPDCMIVIHKNNWENHKLNHIITECPYCGKGVEFKTELEKHIRNRCTKKINFDVFPRKCEEGDEVLETFSYAHLSRLCQISEVPIDPTNSASNTQTPTIGLRENEFEDINTFHKYEEEENVGLPKFKELR